MGSEGGIATCQVQREGSTLDSDTQGPRVILFSASEAKGLLDHVYALLGGAPLVQRWTEDVFEPGDFTLERLLIRCGEVDFAVIILTPDDEVTTRGETKRVPRGNLLVEAGMFLAALGRHRVFLLYDEGANMALPTDWLGLVKQPWHVVGESSNPDDFSYIEEPVSKIRQAIKDRGVIAHPFELVVGEAEIYDRAIAMLAIERVERVDIYAPTGLWDLFDRRDEKSLPTARRIPLKPKEKWFEALAANLETGTHETHSGIGEVRAIFGLPPSIEDFGVVESQMARFDGLSGAILRYLPARAPMERLQGTGLVVFEGKGAGLGFAVGGHHTTVDQTLFISEPAELAMLTQWFDEGWCRLGQYTLKDAREPEGSLEEGLARARESYEAPMRAGRSASRASSRPSAT